QRVLGVALQAGDEGEDVRPLPAGGREQLGQLRPAVGQGAGLVEDGGAAGVDLLQDGGGPDEEAAAGAGRERGGGEPRAAGGRSARGVAPARTAGKRVGPERTPQAARARATARGV